MFRRLHRLSAAPAGRAAALLAVLAVVVRLVLAMAPMPAAMVPGVAGEQADALAALLSGQGICHGDPDGPAAPSPGDAACQLCPLCVALGTPLPVGVMPMPARAVVLLGANALPPPSTGPPASPFSLARPRGPPALSA